MDSHGFFFQAFVYLTAAVLAVPLAKRLGFGSVLGYLLAGIGIGPHGLGLILGGGGDVMHFAEFGVVMMLFLIGLELKPALLWELRGPILGLGGLQVAVTTVAVGALALALGATWRAALTIGMIAAMSSTAIVLQSLNEKGLLKTRGGQACFSVLLFQDLAVIPILAILPLLAVTHMKPEEAHGLAALPGWQQALITLAVVVAIVFVGRFLLRHFFRYVAASQLREVFTATALLLVVGIALLMQAVGLSPAFGAFLAGVVLAENEYRHQLEADIEPFKGLLLGLFFISVGASLDLALIANHPGQIAQYVALLLVVKFVVLFALGRSFRQEWPEAFLFSFALAQGGEFAFVLLSLSEQQGVLAPSVVAPLVATVAVSMAFTPLLLVIYEKVVLPRFSKARENREADRIDEHNNPVILAGFGRFGHFVGRLLRANGFGVTVLEHDADWVETLRRFNMKVFYGDASREDLLRLAGAEQAKLFICTIGDQEKSLAMLDRVREHFPHLQLFARATDRQHAYELLRRGIAHTFHDTMGSALDLGAEALQSLGVRANQAVRLAHIFKQHERAALDELAKIPMEDERYASRARQHNENLARLMAKDTGRAPESPDDAWEIGLPQNPD